MESINDGANAADDSLNESTADVRYASSSLSAQYFTSCVGQLVSLAYTPSINSHSDI